MIGLRTETVRVAFDARTGLLDGFTVTNEGAQIAPLHRAPWVGTDEAMPDDAAPLMATLGGDFFCAPFAGSENGSPLHGWPPNSPWRVIKADAVELQAELERQVFGARLIKTLTLRPGHPFVYQTHRFQGGEGRVAVANHANVALKQGGLIRTSPKRLWETPKDPQESDPERGRSALTYPAQSTDPRHFPATGGTVDLTRYPWASRHEDFVVGVEALGHTLGWTAVTRPAEGDLYLSLRNARDLPMTMLWHSNGGRDYPPWSGRHFGCLGVEEGAAHQMLGLSSEADLSGPGAVTLRQNGQVDVRHVIGAIRWPGGAPVSEVRVTRDGLRIVAEDGSLRVVLFDRDFLRL